MFEIASDSVCISFSKKLAVRLASAIACTLTLHMLAYVSRFIEQTEMIPVIFRVLSHSELSNLSVMWTQTVGDTDFIS